MNELLTKEGPERREFFEKVGITPEVAGRLATLTASSGAASQISQRMQETTGAAVSEAIGEYRETGIGREGTLQSNLAGETQGMGTGKGVENELINQIIQKEGDLWMAEDPVGRSAADLMNLGPGERREMLERWFRRQYTQRHGEKAAERVFEPRVPAPYGGTTGVYTGVHWDDGKLSFPGLKGVEPELKEIYQEFTGGKSQTTIININRGSRETTGATRTGQ